MTSYDYKVVPAPRRARKVKGVKGAEELFAATVADTLNEIARQGWEYVRAETLPAEAPGGWFRRSVSGEQTVLIFRRARETAGPRLAAVRPEASSVELPREPELGAPVDRAAERVVVDRLQSTLRHQPVRLEPIVGDAGEPPVATPVATPLRPTPRLGPADQS